MRIRVDAAGRETAAATPECPLTTPERADRQLCVSLVDHTIHGRNPVMPLRRVSGLLRVVVPGSFGHPPDEQHHRLGVLSFVELFEEVASGSKGFPLCQCPLGHARQIARSGVFSPPHPSVRYWRLRMRGESLLANGQTACMTDSADLEHISDAMHDEWFDLDRAVHDVERAEFRLAIYPAAERGRLITKANAPREPLPAPVAELVVRSVLQVDVADDAGIGWFDFAGIAYSPDTKVVRLWSHFPLEIRITVRELDLALVRP
jgi:hypothetical protein